MSVLAPALEIARRLRPLELVGVVSGVRGLIVLVDDLPAPVGTLVRIGGNDVSSDGPALGEVVGFSREQAIVMILGQTAGIRAGQPVLAMQSAPIAMVGNAMLGRVINALSQPIDRIDAPLRELAPRALLPDPVSPMLRRRVTQPLLTGVRAIDLMTPLGQGQRMGIFAGPGVGKSTLMSTIAKQTSADVNVIALIGERGREVKDFIEHALGPSGLARSVVVVATGDESPLMRVRASRLACSISEHFRDQGKAVLLMMDSVTRFAHAQRQIGLSAGEPPATKGYTPSVFSQMALLMERAGALERSATGGRGGSITGLYTILVEGDDMTEPVADAARGILDGHVMLSRKLAQKAHFPAIDVLDSVSRVADDVASSEHMSARRQVSKLLATYREVEDLVNIGAYARGSNPEADVAIEYQRAINDILRQGKDDKLTSEQGMQLFLKLASESAEAIRRLSTARPGGQQVKRG
jgi:flagellum-specific ATP synthase